MRQCDQCKASMQPYVPRSRVGNEMLCPACAATPRGGMVSAGRKTERKKMSSIRVKAHDSGDQFRIFHCPMCGSGQVTARSDGAVDCGFCGVNFMVRIQPAYPAFAQTVDGVPIDVPGVPPSQSTNGTPADGVDPLAAQQDEEDQPINPEDVSEEGQAPEEDGEENPFAKNSYRTASGVFLNENDYIRHLAVEAGSRSPQILRAVKASRLGEDCENPDHEGARMYGPDVEPCQDCIDEAEDRREDQDFGSRRDDRLDRS